MRFDSEWRQHGLALFCACTALMLAACAASPTPFQPSTDGYGYSQQKIEGNRYRVTFAGNSETSLDTVRNYMLVRAAEVTLENGGDYFTITDQSTQSATSYRGTGTGPVGFGTGFSTGGVGVGMSSFSAYPSDSYTAWADIVIGEGAKPADDLNAYDARAVLSQLDPTVVRAPGVLRVIPPPQASDG
jgi:hypothetical protein